MCWNCTGWLGLAWPTQRVRFTYGSAPRTQRDGADPSRLYLQSNFGWNTDVYIEYSCQLSWISPNTAYGGPGRSGSGFDLHQCHGAP